MRPSLVLLLVLGLVLDLPAQDDYNPSPDSIAQPNVPKGELIKGTYTAKEGSVFPGTERDYTIYLPPRNDGTPAVEKNHDKSVVAPSPFMIFQDGVIYNALVVFDNFIAKKQIPPLIGIFIKPGVVPAANPNALPRDNRSYEYDSVTDTYARFLIDEFIPAIEKKHNLKLSTDPNDAAICGNSSGGICAFMAAWHRPDRIRRVFSAVGTYVGIRGGDQLPVLIRKYEPKPLRVYLQTGEHDNNIYCGDWWMANQMMERALAWAGYDVNHAWGTGGHNQKHATQIFPDVLRWLWRDHATAKEIKANPRGESKWVGYMVLGEGKWESIALPERNQNTLWRDVKRITPKRTGEVLVTRESENVTDRFEVRVIQTNGSSDHVLLGQPGHTKVVTALAAGGNDTLQYWMRDYDNPGIEETFNSIDSNKKTVTTKIREKSEQEKKNNSAANDRPDLKRHPGGIEEMVVLNNGLSYLLDWSGFTFLWRHGEAIEVAPSFGDDPGVGLPVRLAVSPDQTQIFATTKDSAMITSYRIEKDGSWSHWQDYFHLDLGGLEATALKAAGLCVDTNGWLYVATALGIQVCDTAGRVNFIIPTPQQPHDVCFGGKDLGELFIACGDKIYKRLTKAHGIVSAQMAPIKPVPRKL